MALTAFAACLTFGALADGPTVSSVVVRQRWPWSRLVDIDYMLLCEATQRCDVAVAAFDGATPLILPENSLSSDRYGLSDGTHRIVWDPMSTAYTNSAAMAQFRIELTPTLSPLYMIVDLTNAVGTTAHVEYVYPGDARLETSGRWTNIWYGATNDTAYTTTRLVLRRIQAGTFRMQGNRTVTLSKDYYVGIFEVTQEQWFNVMGSWPVPHYGSARPVEGVTYDSIRGSSSGTNWPSSNAVDADSFMGTLRAKSGLTTIDLPTEAQWEYACRAGTTTYYNDGEEGVVLTKLGSEEIDNNGNTNRYLNVLGRYKFNGSGSAVVGSYLPNNWGVYDTHGNEYEWCLDWYVSSLGTVPAVDPTGPASSTLGRVRRGGSRNHPASSCISNNRYYYTTTGIAGWMGFRIARPLP